MNYYNHRKFAKETDEIPSGNKTSTLAPPSSPEEEAILNICTGNNSKSAIVHNDIKRCIQYLNMKGIDTPDDFDKILAEERNVFFSSSSRTIPLTTIDSIIRACELWRPYIDPLCFDDLVCAEVKSMFRLEACSLCYTNSKDELKAYIGNFATLTELPPLGMSTSVSYYGKVTAFGV